MLLVIENAGQRQVLGTLTPALQRESLRFSECLEEYLQFSEAHKQPSSYKRDQTAARRLLKEFGPRWISEITQKDIEKFQGKRAQEVKSATCNRDFEPLRHLFTKAIEWGYIQTNPAQRVKQLKTPPGRIRYLSFEERDRLLVECAPNLMLFAVVAGALSTGMRRGELMRLKWEDVSFEMRTIYLRQTKNNTARAVPISNSLLTFLHKFYKKRVGEFVFSKPDGKPYGDWKRSFATACRRAGVKDFRFHDLRHTFASYLVMNNVNIRVVQELMGHKDIKMTTRYMHLSQKDLFKAVNKTSKGKNCRLDLYPNPPKQLTGKRFTKALLYR
ncbi:Tyrosine recombinase XerD [subsurface metagenome]|nr:tyrosine-type recombinase/integrase [bacterium]